MVGSGSGLNNDVKYVQFVSKESDVCKENQKDLVHSQSKEQEKSATVEDLSPSCAMSTETNTKLMPVLVEASNHIDKCENLTLQDDGKLKDPVAIFQGGIENVFLLAMQ